MTASTNSPDGRVSWRDRSLRSTCPGPCSGGRGENRAPNANVTPLTRDAKALGTSSFRAFGRLESLRIPLYSGALVAGALATVAQRGPHRDWRTAFFAGLVSGGLLDRDHHARPCDYRSKLGGRCARGA